MGTPRTRLKTLRLCLLLDSSLLGLSRLRRSHAPPQCVQDERSADAEADHGGKRHQIQRTTRHPEVIREQRDHGTENAEDVKPERRMNIRKILPEPNLKQ